MAIQTKTMMVKSDTALAETTTTIRDTVTFDTSKLPNGITYKGLKAVLSFSDPIQWNKASTYDSLTVVWDDATHASYVSKRRVPQNIELTNEFYWFRTADLDAQVEMYRSEVQEFDGRITANAQAIATETARAEKAETKNLLVVGDSYTQLSASTWSETFAKRAGMKLYKHATSSMAFNKTEDWQSGKFIDNLVWDDYISKHGDELDMLICYGGINDNISTDTKKYDFYNAVKTFADKAIETYPNATVIIVGPQRAVTTDSIELCDKVHLMRKACNESGVAYINAANWQFWGSEYYGTYYGKDNIHPNANGYTYIASCMQNAILGDGFKPNLGLVKLAAPDNATNVKVMKTNDEVIITFDTEAKGTIYNFTSVKPLGNPFNLGTNGLYKIDVYSDVSNYIGKKLAQAISNSGIIGAIALETFDTQKVHVITSFKCNFIE